MSDAQELLVTTHDPRFWSGEGARVLLGTWCLGAATAADAGEQVMAHPWLDGEVRHAEFQRVDHLYERFLQSLTPVMNSAHGMQASERHWRIVLGPWLKYALDIFYERYRCLTHAAALNSGLTTRVPSETLQPLYDFNEFVDETIDDHYNTLLYGEIVRCTGLFAFEEKSLGARGRRSAKQGTRFPSLSRRLPRWLTRPAASRRLFIKDSQGTKLWQWKTHLANGSWPHLLQPAGIAAPESTARPRSALRETKATLIAVDDFEAIAWRLLWLTMPLCYLESFAAVREHARANYPVKAKMIVSANSYFADESFKTWCGQQVDTHNAQIVSEQHGGLYGVGRHSSNENHEAKIADCYLTWGWKRNDVTCLPVASGKLLRATRELKANEDGTILLVQRSAPRYSYFYYSSPLPSQMSDALDDQFLFTANLEAGARSLLRVRLHASDYGWGFREKWRRQAGSLKMSDGSMTMNQELAASRLFVGTYNATTFLEAFAANYPTVLFWNPEHWLLSDQARARFAELEAARIFFRDARAAAAHVNEIYRSPVTWWKSGDVQRARERFCQDYAWTTPGWRRDWKEKLGQLLTSSRTGSRWTYPS